MEPIEILVILMAISVGVYVVSPGLVRKVPVARTIHSWLKPLHGIIGIGVGLFGAAALVLLIFAYGWWLLFPLTLIVASGILAVLGFLLGYQLISKRALTDDQEAKKLADGFSARWEPRQNMLGWTSLILGISALILYAVR